MTGTEPLDALLSELARDRLDIQKLGEAICALRGQDQLAVAAMVANIADHCDDRQRCKSLTAIASAIALRGARKFARAHHLPMPYTSR
jgi:ribosomal 50S subunit-associated protein YjgA (DUF615 family)